MRLRIQKQGVRRQNEKSKSEYVFSTDYFNIASNLKAHRAAPPTSNSPLHALCPSKSETGNPPEGWESAGQILIQRLGT